MRSTVLPQLCQNAESLIQEMCQKELTEYERNAWKVCRGLLHFSISLIKNENARTLGEDLLNLLDNRSLGKDNLLYTVVSNSAFMYFYFSLEKLEGGLGAVEKTDKNYTIHMPGRKVALIYRPQGTSFQDLIFEKYMNNKDLLPEVRKDLAKSIRPKLLDAYCETLYILCEILNIVLVRC